MTHCTCPTQFASNGQLERAYLDALCPVHAQQTGQHCPTCRCNEVGPKEAQAREALTQAVRAKYAETCNHASYARVEGKCGGCGAEVR